MHAKIVSCSAADVTAEVFNWNKESLGTITVPWDGEGWVEVGAIEGCNNEALDRALDDIGEEARQDAINEAVHEIECSILDEFRRRAEGRSDG